MGLVLLVMNNHAVSDIIRDRLQFGSHTLAIQPGSLGPNVDIRPFTNMPDVFAYSLSGDRVVGGSPVKEIALVSDPDANQLFYGRRLSTEEIVRDRTMEVPEDNPPVATSFEKDLERTTD